MAGCSQGRGGNLEVRIGVQEAGRGEECGGYGAVYRGEIGRRRVGTAVPNRVPFHAI